MSPFEVLGLGNNPTLEEVKSSYRKLALKYHPDSSSNYSDPVKFREITEAYRKSLILIKHPENLIGIDLYEDFVISVKESIFGVNRSFQISKIIPCDCGSIGIKCFKCHGSKYIKKGLTLKSKCPRCDGTGFENTKNCGRCFGSGYRTITESIKLSTKVPISNGELRIFKYSQGNLNITFRIEHDELDLYDRVDNNLIYYANISPIDQIIGTVLLIPRINKDSYRLVINENCKIPSYFKLQGDGVPTTNGDLIIKVQLDNRLLDNNLIPIIKQAVRNYYAGST